MESLRELYRIGRGPSSSHTMGPSHAAALFKKEYPQADRFRAALYGSLAKTGKGHLTDVAIVDAFAPLPTGAIKPLGYLLAAERAQANGLGGQITRVWDGLRDSAWMPPWNSPTQMARIQNSSASRRKNAANSVMQKYANTATSSMRFVPNLVDRRP